MKKKLGLIVVLGVLTLSFVYTTTALFNSGQTKRGIITTGKVQIALLEKNHRGEPYVEGTKPIVPGDSIERVPTVKNEGNKAVWVRVKILKRFIQPRNDLDVVDLDLFRHDFKPGWILETDGYYYYTKKLEAGEQTTPVFENETLDILADNRFSDQKLEIDVQAEAVQSDNNGQSVADAVGW